MHVYTKTQFNDTRKNYRNLLLVKTDKNGSDYYEANCTCDRCMGEGLIYAGRVNGKLVTVIPDNGVCWKCNGSRIMPVKVKVMTDEYGAKLEEKRKEKIQQNIEEAHKRMEEKRTMIRESNMHLGYKSIDFTLDEWVGINLEKFKFYRIAVKTSKAYLIHLLDDIYKDDCQSVDRWVTISAFHLEEVK